jgi:aspartokinase-like uncharacterized kinase
MNWTVVKVGGSLYDWPMLGERLAAWLMQHDADRVLIVPGGGAAADAIREMDRLHHLGEETAHWLAIRALSLNAHVVRTLVPECALVSDLTDCRTSCHRLHVLDAFPFFMADEMRPDCLPHTWQVTSDSLAKRVAVLLQANELVLLKSVDWTGANWQEAIEAGIVDGHFGAALTGAGTGLRTHIVNLRAWIPERRSAPTPAGP